MNELAAVKPILQQSLTVRIPGRPPTANARRHWRSVARDNELWKAAASTIAGVERAKWEQQHGLRWRPIRRCDVLVRFVVKDRRARDWDNLIGSIKPELDGVVDAGVILDDSNRVIRRVSFEIVYEKGDTATEFEIAEIDDD